MDGITVLDMLLESSAYIRILSYRSFALLMLVSVMEEIT